MIYYANVNEDSRVERRMIRGKQIQHLHCIVGSGERLIALLDTPGLTSVHAIDLNQEALFLGQLKIHALRVLEVKDYLKFVGFEECPQALRLIHFESLSNGLPPACRSYWASRRRELSKGICHFGHFEQFLARIRPMVLTFLGKSFLKAFENDFSSFPHLRWSLVKRSFSWPSVYRLFGNRDVAFIGQGSHLGLIPKGLQDLMDEGQLNASFMAHLIFRGHLRAMPSKWGPPSTQGTTLARIQTRLRREAFVIHWQEGDLLHVLRSTPSIPEGERLFASLSDILSFIGTDYLHDCLQELERISAGRYHVAVRAFLKRRQELLDLCRDLEPGHRIRDQTPWESTRMYTVFEIGRG